MKIQINKNPFAETKYYAGIYSTKKDYPFTLAVEDYRESKVKFVQEITWEAERPKNYRRVEKKIEAFHNKNIFFL